MVGSDVDHNSDDQNSIEPAPAGPDSTLAPVGHALLGTLQAVSSDAVALLTPLSDARHRPPTTTQDRRRLARRASDTISALDEVCDRLEGFLSDVSTMVARAEPTAGTPAEPSADAPAAPLAERAPLADSAPVDSTPSESALADLVRHQRALREANARLHETVAIARGSGASWRRIGEALGIAGQTAHKRFDPQARRRHADYMRARYRPVGQSASEAERSP